MIKQLNENMLYSNNLYQYTKHIINKTESNKIESNKTKSNKTESNKTESNKTESNKTKSNKTKSNNKKVDLNLAEFFIPNEEDKLFWCFYILLKGKDNYEYIKENSFKAEKDFKIKSIEELRNQKDILKLYKIKRVQIEDELLNNKKITIVGLNALALIYKINIICVSNKQFILMNYSETEMIENTSNIIMQKNVDYRIYNSTNKNIDYKFEVDNIINNYWKIENINKPIKSISSYTLAELTNICNKLNIQITNQNTTKKKTKKELFDDILSNISLKI